MGVLPQKVNPQGRLNMMGKLLADVKCIGWDHMSKIRLDDRVC